VDGIKLSQDIFLARRSCEHGYENLGYIKGHLSNIQTIISFLSRIQFNKIDVFVEWQVGIG
jgi:hypothetical protein